MIPQVIARDPQFRRGRYTLAETLDGPKIERRIPFPDIGPFVSNKLLTDFIAAIPNHPLNDVLLSRLRSVLSDLSQESGKRLLDINELTFDSDLRSPWDENNRVYAYLYRRGDAKAIGPGIVVPGFIKGTPLTRALTLLLADIGWTVLEVAVPFFDKRQSATTKARSTLSERWAALRLTPEDFAGYVEQAVSDVRRPSIWFSRQLCVDPERVAISGFSFGASVALTAFATTPELTHAVSICPPVDWAHAIWTAEDQQAYRRFLQSVLVTQQEFAESVSPVQLDQLTALGNRAAKSRVLYVNGDPYTPSAAMKWLAARLGSIESFEPQGVGQANPNLDGLQPYFAAVFDRTVELVIGSKPAH